MIGLPHRSIEGGHDGIPDELKYRPAFTENARCRDAKDLVERKDDLLGGRTLRKRCESSEVGEHGRQNNNCAVSRSASCPPGRTTSRMPAAVPFTDRGITKMSLATRAGFKVVSAAWAAVRLRSASASFHGCAVERWGG